MIKRDLGTAQFSVDKITNETGESGRKLILGVFALVYVVEGNVRIDLDENSPQGFNGVLNPGQTLYVERDEDASPTSMVIQASDASGSVGNRDVGMWPIYKGGKIRLLIFFTAEDATIVTIQITEIKPKGAPSTIGTTLSDYFSMQASMYSAANTPAVGITTTATAASAAPAATPGGGLVGVSNSAPQNEEDAPSRRREPRRKGSLVVYDDQPYWNLPQNVAQRMAAQESNASASAIPSSSEDIGGELASQLKQESNFANTQAPPALLRGKMESSQIYEPPTFSFLNQDTDVPPPVVRDRLVVEDFPKHSISTAWIKMVKQGLSEWLRLPVIVCRGTEDGYVQNIIYILMITTHIVFPL